MGGRIRGDSSLEIRAVRPLEAAEPGDLTLAAGRKNLERLEACPASAFIVPLGVTSGTKTVLEVDNPKLAFAQILNYVYGKQFTAKGISPLAVVGEDCRIPPEVSLYPFACIGDRVSLGLRVTVSSGVHIGDDCVVGDDVVLHPNVVLYPGVRLGNRVVIHSGTVIGADGFGYVFDGSQHVKIPQTGTVLIEDDVEIGANSCVDRATFGATVVERGVKLDNHVHIGHNCRVGSNTIMVAQVGISGSVNVGRNCIFAGHSGVVDHVTIGDDVRVMMKAGVSKDVPPKSSVSGQPAMDHRQAMRIESITRRLPEIYEEWKQLKKRMKRNQTDRLTD